MDYAQCLDPLSAGELQGFVAESYNHDLPDLAEQPLRGKESSASPPDQPPASATTPAAPDLCRSSVTRGRSICIAVGDDCCTEKVLKYAAKYICKFQDNITLLHISKASNSRRPHEDGSAHYGRPSDAGEGMVRDSMVSKEGQLLVNSKGILLQSGKVRSDQVTIAVLPSVKHVGQALVSHCLQTSCDILVIGSRGISPMKGKLMSLVGEGSVSKYCVDNLPSHIAVVVVKPPVGHDWGKS